MSAYDTLLFQEIDAQKRQVILRNTEAPMGHMRGNSAFDLGGEMRASVHDEPGGDIPTVHIMGDKQRPLVVHGHFRDSLTQSNGHALSRVEYIESIRLAARPLRILWGRVLRIGFLKETKFGVEAEGEFQYEFTFHILSMGQQPKRNLGKRPLGLVVALQGMDEIINTARTSFKFQGFDLGISTIIDGLFSAVAGPMLLWVSMAADLESNTSDLIAGVKGIATRLNQMASQAQTVINGLNSIVSYLSSAQDTSEDAVASANWQKARSDAMDALMRVVADARGVGTACESKALGSTGGRVVTTSAGDTIENIARRYSVKAEDIRALNPRAPVGFLPTGTKLTMPPGS